jgi:cob(I)alamin adenosyltransferase
MNNKFDGIVGVLGITVGLIGVGYALGTHSKMAKISDNLDRSIDELASRMPVDIPNDMIERAVEKAVTAQVKDAVGKATDGVLYDIKRDIHKQVVDAVEKEYDNIKDEVLQKATEAAAKIDVARVRRDVERAAVNKYECNLDDILAKFNDNLSNTSKIYSSIASAITRPTESGKEVVFKVG